MRGNVASGAGRLHLPDVRAGRLRIDDYSPGIEDPPLFDNRLESEKGWMTAPSSYTLGVNTIIEVAYASPCCRLGSDCFS